MAYTTRQLAIIASTVSIHLTAQEQRLGEAFIAGLHNLPPPYRSSEMRNAYRVGMELRHAKRNVRYADMLLSYRFEEGLNDRYNDRHPELDQ